MCALKEDGEWRMENGKAKNEKTMVKIFLFCFKLFVLDFSIIYFRLSIFLKTKDFL